MKTKRLTLAVLSVLVSASVGAQQPRAIDMHLHAQGLIGYGPPPHRICASGIEAFLARSSEVPAKIGELVACREWMEAPASDEAILEATIERLERHGMKAVVSGNIDRVQQWYEAAPDRFIPAVSFSSRTAPPVGVLRQLIDEGKVKVIGEITAQYEGLAPNDPELAPYWSLAAETGTPVAIHMAAGFPGTAQTAGSGYRAEFGNPLLLEPVLRRHPGLRVNVMHAGYPMIDELVALMRTWPQTYADLGMLSWLMPEAEFHRVLKRLVDAGFSKRILYGSDQMIWPRAITISLGRIENADYLSDEQRRDILYGNAKRFLEGE